MSGCCKTRSRKVIWAISLSLAASGIAITLVGYAKGKDCFKVFNDCKDIDLSYSVCADIADQKCNYNTWLALIIVGCSLFLSAFPVPLIYFCCCIRNSSSSDEEETDEPKFRPGQDTMYAGSPSISTGGPANSIPPTPYTMHSSVPSHGGRSSNQEIYHNNNAHAKATITYGDARNEKYRSQPSSNLYEPSESRPGRSGQVEMTYEHPGDRYAPPPDSMGVYEGQLNVYERRGVQHQSSHDVSHELPREGPYMPRGQPRLEPAGGYVGGRYSNAASDSYEPDAYNDNSAINMHASYDMSGRRAPARQDVEQVYRHSESRESGGPSQDGRWNRSDTNTYPERYERRAPTPPSQQLMQATPFEAQRNVPFEQSMLRSQKYSSQARRSPMLGRPAGASESDDQRNGGHSVVRILVTDRP